MEFVHEEMSHVIFQFAKLPWTCDGHSSLHPAAFAMDLLDIVVPHFSATSIGIMKSFSKTTFLPEKFPTAWADFEYL